MTSRPLGPQDLKQLGPLPPDSRLKGTVKLVKHLKPSECLEFCLDLADNSPGPFKRARVAVTTGIRNAGMNVEPLLRAEAALNKAMAAGHKVVLHTGLPGCILRKHELVQKQGRREVELMLENGSKIEIVGTDDVVDFYRDPSHGDTDWFSSPEDDQNLVRPLKKGQTATVIAIAEPIVSSRPLKPLTSLAVPPRLREPGEEINLPKKKAESGIAGLKAKSVIEGQAQNHIKTKIAEQGSTSTGPTGVVPRKRPRESDAAPGPSARSVAPEIRASTTTTTVGMTVAAATPEESGQAVDEIPFGPGDVLPMPVAGPSRRTATTIAGPSETPAAGVSNVATTPQRPSSIAETPLKPSRTTLASTSKRPSPAEEVEKQIAKRLKAQAIAERRQMRALEQAGITMGLDSETDMQRRKEKVAAEMEVAYNRGLQKGSRLTVPYQNHALNVAVSKEINYEPISTWVPQETARKPAKGEKANIIAVVKQFNHTPANMSGGDHRYNIQLQDPSVDQDEFLILTIFSNRVLPFDTILSPGSVLLIRDVWCTETPQGRVAAKVTAKYMGWQWACLQMKPDGTTQEHLGTGKNAPRFPDLSEAERHRMLRLKEWFILIVKPQMDPASLASGGHVLDTTLNGKAQKRITVSQMQLGMFCDMVVEVIDTWGHTDTGRLIVYVADYTFNEHIIDDERLSAQYPLLNGGGIVEFCFWDLNSLEARAQNVKAGDFLFLRNVQVQQWNGNVTGALRVRSDDKQTGPSWKRINITDPLVVELISRKEDVLQRVPEVTPSAPVLPVPPLSGGIEWNANANNSIWTIHSTQPFTMIRDVLANSSVPNRYRLKARASAIRPISKPGDMIVKWCRACQRSFTEDYCHACDDKHRKYAEYRYRFWAVLQDEEGGPKLPCQMEHQSINNLLYELPDIEVQALTPALTKARARIKVLLWGHKINGEHPCGLVDWSVESFEVEHPLAPDHRLTMYRVFGMSGN